MARAKSVIFIAVYIAVFSTASVKCLTDGEIKATLNQASAATRSYETFLKALDVATKHYDTNEFKAAIENLIPAIKYVKDMFVFATMHLESQDPNLKPLKVEFQALNKGFNKIDATVSDVLDRLTSESVVRLYRRQRRPIDNAENNARLYAEASQLEKRSYLRSLQDACHAADPYEYFKERTMNSMAISTLSGGEKNRLVKWIYVITADAARAMSMHQVCLAVLKPTSSYSQMEKDVEEAKQKLFRILDDLKREMDRLVVLEANWAQRYYYEAQALVDANGMTDNIHQIVFDNFASRYQEMYFAAYLLNAEYASKIFDSSRVIEISKNGRTLLVFGLEYEKFNQTRHDQIKAYVDNAQCTNPREANLYRSMTLNEIADPLRKMGAAAVFVTDTQLAVKGHSKASYSNRKTCRAIEELPQHREWDYRRAIIVA